jgi:predicted membrane channel-forming protein YqfA (hemolysin III family)
LSSIRHIFCSFFSNHTYHDRLIDYMYNVCNILFCISWWTIVERTHSLIGHVCDLIFVFIWVKSHSVSLTLQFPQNEIKKKKFVLATWLRGIIDLLLRWKCDSRLQEFPLRLHVVMVWMRIGFLKRWNEHWQVIRVSLMMRQDSLVNASASGELFAVRTSFQVVVTQRVSH